MSEENTKLKLVTIEDIKSNPNLDLTERSKKYLHYGSLPKKEIEKMVLGQIVHDYNRYLKGRTNISKRTDELLNSVLNGHILSKIEEFELTCDDPRKLTEFIKTESITEYIHQNRGITKEEFDIICEKYGIVGLEKRKIENTYKTNGYILENNDEGFKKLL